MKVVMYGLDMKKGRFYLRDLLPTYTRLPVSARSKEKQ